ncbi:cofactor assembly of complex C subunit B [Cronbergia sp. UHCC 0137]|uniref:cofactor assembly of complex C subunit B n=1 Tax=Cronbergia sp. UHCC 0137 TaxID=3110239 RepID=UPI002B207AB3|nr:cofactor assembly of complex C subunit B [Cronbergia sp. UHCC 0137]MEA5621004.1 cofactor assembly of complex C subunit B [Cronbergia sp. UHCC 0137]
MDTPILSSTLLLTVLLSVGLLFFIRAATKDRTQREQLISDQDETTLMNQVKDYFHSRSYRVAELNSEKNQVTFEGYVRPSWFLGAFLTLLAATGLACLALVLALLFPNLGQFFPAIVLLSPLSGLFYWKKAGRLENVSLSMESIQGQLQSSSIITVTAHRDELMELKRALQLKDVNF